MSSAERTIDLNADLGEGCPWDEALLARVCSASICCGAHAGDNVIISATLQTAKVHRVVVGAHPGYPDREHFGREERATSRDEAEALVLSQCKQLADLANTFSMTLRFIKPHGALYNQAQHDEAIAEGIVAAAAKLALPVLGQPGGQVETQARTQGVRFIAEGFADRRYQPDGWLVPRSQAGAILEDAAEVEAQVLKLVEQGIGTLCIHGDDLRSVELADLVCGVLDRAAILRRSFV